MTYENDSDIFLGIVIFKIGLATIFNPYWQLHVSI